MMRRRTAGRRRQTPAEAIVPRGVQRLLPVVCVPFFAVSALSQSPAPAKKISAGILGHLVGTWTITGTTLGRPTATGAEVQKEFGGSFLEVHIADPAGKDPYGAKVFFGERQDGTLVVHWLDGTGAETSQTLGTGRVVGDAVVLRFPYPSGVFRDKLTYDSAHDRWRLLIERGDPGHSKVFSDWYFDRSSPPPTH